MEGALKNEISQENLASMQELHNIQELDFGTLVLALYCFCGDKK